MRNFGRVLMGLWTVCIFSVANAEAAQKAPAADTIASLCTTEGGTHDVCACAAAEFKRVTDKSDYTTYSDVSQRYMARLKQERSNVEAWDDAISTIAIKKRVTPMDLAEKTDALKVKYKAAVEQCANATAALPPSEARNTP